PSTIAEALAGPDAEHWKKAMEQEMEGQRTKGTFHEGEKGVNYFGTFSPVVGFDLIRAVLATAGNRNLIINSLDFTQAHLNAPVPEDVWLQLPNGSIVKAARAIYGLEQSAMEWYKELKVTILAEGWRVTDFEACLYVKRSEDGRIAVLFHYVDDISLTGNFLEEIKRMKSTLLTKYEGRDLGTPDKLVGVAITRDEPGITLDQHFYAESIVREGMRSTELRSTSSPLSPGMDLTARRTDEEELDQRYKPYRTILGKLMFLAGTTRPDLSNSVRELGRYAASPCDRYWRGLQHVLRYLAGTTKVGIDYPAGGEMDNGGLVGYGDSDWGNDIASRRRIQGAVTTSSSEVEWTAVMHGMRHAIFLRAILGELGILKGVTVWYGDNRGAIQAATTEGFNGRTRHVDIKLKCTEEYVSKGQFTVKYIPMTLQLAEILTKTLRKKQVEDFV
ncbi:unnamed protein product, partial [Choristocarpus tenellus]